MSKFKVGDIVVRTGYDFADVVHGRNYKVTSVSDSDNGGIKIETLSGLKYFDWYYEAEFELATPVVVPDVKSNRTITKDDIKSLMREAIRQSWTEATTAGTTSQIGDIVDQVFDAYINRLSTK